MLVRQVLRPAHGTGFRIRSLYIYIYIYIYIHIHIYIYIYMLEMIETGPNSNISIVYMVGDCLQKKTMQTKPITSTL